MSSCGICELMHWTDFGEFEMTDSKRAERRRKRRKSAAAGRPANYSQLYKDDHTTGQSHSAEASDGSDNNKSSGSGREAETGTRVLSGKGTESIDWQGEYHHVLRDLRMVLLVSLLIFAVMFTAGYLL